LTTTEKENEMCITQEYLPNRNVRIKPYVTWRAKRTQRANTT